MDTPPEKDGNEFAERSAIQSYKLPVVLNRQNGMTTTHVDTRIMTTIDNGPQPRKEWVLGSNMSSGAQR